MPRLSIALSSCVLVGVIQPAAWPAGSPSYAVNKSDSTLTQSGNAFIHGTGGLGGSSSHYPGSTSTAGDQN